MKSLFSRLLIVSSALLLTPQLAAAQTTPQSLLIRVHEIVTEGISGSVVTVTTLIFRDRLVIQQAVSADLCGHVLRAVGSKAAFDALNRALQENRVGTQAGGCQIETGAPQSTSRDTILTWFGARNRRNTFRVGDEIGTQLCDAEAELIRNAIDDYAEIAGATDPNAVFIQPCQ